MSQRSSEPGPSYWRVSLALALRKRSVETSETEALQRRLTALDLTLIGVGASVGAGIFVITGIAAKPTGPAVCFSFLLAGISSIFSALCYAELSARIPVSGSVYLYAFVAFGEFIALLIGLNVLVDYHVGAAVNIASCALYLEKTLRLMFGDVCVWLPSTQVISLLMVLLLTCILSVGVENGLKRVNGLLVFGKVGIVLLVIVVGCTKVQPTNLSPVFPFGVGPVLSMSATCSFSFIGFGTVTNAAEECINPHRDLPIGITLSLLICALLYIAFSIVLVGIIPYDEIDSAAPAENAFGKHYANIPWALMLVNWGAVIGLFTTLITGLYSQARIYLAMARDGLFFQAFGRVSPTFGTPIHAQWLCGAIAALLACVPVDKLALFLSIGVLLSYTVVCAGVLVLRAESPEQAAKWSGLVTLAAVAASLCSSYILSSKNYLAIAATAVFALLAMLCWVPFFQVPYSRPSTFACPGCPTIPLFGLTINGYLLSQCHWQAWLRLVLTSFLILGAYALRVRKSLKTPGSRNQRDLHLSLAVQPDTVSS